MSNQPTKCFRLPQGFVIEVVGTDALTVVNNLATNDLVSLQEFSSCESFITNIKGWVVAHCLVLKLPDRVLLLGQHPSPSLICEHIDRYIIREDAQVADISADKCLVVAALADLPESTPAGTIRLPMRLIGFELLFGDREKETQIISSLGIGPRLGEVELGDDEEFEDQRIRSFWPLKGNEIGEKTIPQELDRDAVAISFTKGCYLGQETIARLDARGQLQKKLCLLAIPGETPPVIGALAMSGDREVGEITSVSANADGTYALGYLKRPYFELGTKIDFDGVSAEVINPALPPSYSN